MTAEGHRGQLTVGFPSEVIGSEVWLIDVEQNLAHKTPTGRSRNAAASDRRRRGGGGWRNCRSLSCSRCSRCSRTRYSRGTLRRDRSARLLVEEVKNNVRGRLPTAVIQQRKETFRVCSRFVG